ncbi:putative ER membrane protein complex subunit 6 [Hypsibius exemplaris]|uniref:ER membrane protein complex subunit 6 n=1 Tax=Hypsibius exemplaris TaxID=2072580 RepID=A0A1W0X3K8_HYPEX|nr:putative ER membrane protein complex subunit 6 [Hypsibius exemplaris]
MSDSNQTDDKLPVYNELAAMQNLGSLDYCRIFTALLSGSTAGILGLTGLYGFIFFFVANGVLGLFVLQKYSLHYQQYFKQCYIIFSHGLFGSLLTYILFWTFLYGLVHVY